MSRRSALWGRMVRSVSLFLTASSFLALNAAADEAADQSTPSAQAAPRETVALPKAVPDPIEPMNRNVLWS